MANTLLQSFMKSWGSALGLANWDGGPYFVKINKYINKNKNKKRLCSKYMGIIHPQAPRKGYEMVKEERGDSV